MESRIPKRSVEFTRDDVRHSFANELCLQTRQTLIECAMNNKCTCSTGNKMLTRKQEVKEAIFEGKDVLLYLNITEEIARQPVYSKFYPDNKEVMSFMIVGWDDYAYLKVKTELGVEKRHRGYFIVVPTNLPICDDNIHYIPYKLFDIGDKDDNADFVKEVWSMNNIVNDVNEVERPCMKFRIGESLFIKDDVVYSLDSCCAYYHTFGNPLVPIRVVAEQLGYTVKWHRYTKTIELISHNDHIIVQVGKDLCNVNGVDEQLQFPVTINKYDKRAYVNLGFVRRILLKEAVFDKKTETVKIFTE